MSLRATSTEEASEMLDAWFAEPFGGGKDEAMVGLLAEADREPAVRASE